MRPTQFVVVGPAATSREKVPSPPPPPSGQTFPPSPLRASPSPETALGPANKTPRRKRTAEREFAKSYLSLALPPLGPPTAPHLIASFSSFLCFERGRCLDPRVSEKKVSASFISPFPLLPSEAEGGAKLEKSKKEGGREGGRLSPSLLPPLVAIRPSVLPGCAAIPPFSLMPFPFQFPVSKSFILVFRRR